MSRMTPMDAYLQATLIEMESATQGLNDDDLNRLRLGPGKWTAGQTLEHLILAFTSTTAHMRKSAKSGHDVPSPTLKQRVGRFVVVGLGHMPEGRTAPEFTRPLEVPAPNVPERFRQAVRDMDAAITAREEQCRRTECVAVHAILGPLTARDWRRFHLVHTRHHMDQIRAMRRAERRFQASAA